MVLSVEEAGHDVGRVLAIAESAIAHPALAPAGTAVQRISNVLRNLALRHPHATVMACHSLQQRLRYLTVALPAALPAAIAAVQASCGGVVALYVAPRQAVAAQLGLATAAMAGSCLMDNLSVNCFERGVPHQRVLGADTQTIVSNAAGTSLRDALMPGYLQEAILKLMKLEEKEKDLLLPEEWAAVHAVLRHLGGVEAKHLAPADLTQRVVRLPPAELGEKLLKGLGDCSELELGDFEPIKVCTAVHMLCCLALSMGLPQSRMLAGAMTTFGLSEVVAAAGGGLSLSGCLQEIGLSVADKAAFSSALCDDAAMRTVPARLAEISSTVAGLTEAGASIWRLYAGRVQQGSRDDARSTLKQLYLLPSLGETVVHSAGFGGFIGNLNTERREAEAHLESGQSELRQQVAEIKETLQEKMEGMRKMLNVVQAQIARLIGEQQGA